MTQDHTITESYSAVADRLSTALDQTRAEQSRDLKFVEANGKELIARAKAALKNTMLGAVQRQQKALEHIDGLDQMLATLIPQYQKYIETKPQDETDKNNADIAAATAPDGSFYPKTLGGTMEQRAKTGLLLGKLVTARMDVANQIVSMNAEITVNINLPADGDKPDIVDAEAYDPEKDFEKI